jgi:CBS domain-containing protein
MAEYDVGTVVVLEGDRLDHAAGLLTDRDVAVRCLAQRLNPDETTVSQVMTAPVHTVSEDTPIEEAVAHMAGVGVRRLVVTGEQGRVVGILSLDDVMEVLVGEMNAIGRVLEKQQPRVPA